MKIQMILSWHYTTSAFALGTAMNTTEGSCQKCYKKWKDIWINTNGKEEKDFLVHKPYDLVDMYVELLDCYDIKPNWEKYEGLQT